MRNIADFVISYIRAEGKKKKHKEELNRVEKIYKNTEKRIDFFEIEKLNKIKNEYNNAVSESLDASNEIRNLIPEEVYGSWIVVETGRQEIDIMVDKNYIKTKTSL